MIFRTANLISNPRFCKNLFPENIRRTVICEKIGKIAKIPAHPMNIGDCLAWARKRHHILARPNDKSGMTLKPCTSAQFQRDLKIRNILDTTKNSSASCVFIIRLLKRLGGPGGRSTGVVNCHYSQNLCNQLYINKLPL